jgi:glycosyltransferase involved in cell wall biosynthesis
MRILVATNNFWVGGRETYTDTYLGELGAEAALIASNVDRAAPGIERFSEIVECGQWTAWLERGRELIERFKPDVIWAHHYDLLPAWLLSRIHRVPLLTTFHGPLTGAGRPNDLIQSLGMTLAIHRGAAITAVSEESRQTLPAQGLLLPNAVALAPTTLPPTLPPRRFVLLTRRDKLEHIRQSALLFARYASEVSGCTLVVADGEMQFEAKDARSVRAALRQLGARWSASQGVRFLRRLPRIHFIGWTSDSRNAIRNADVVLGMGRVVLEAIAEGRPAVLIGYGDVHGLVTADNFDEWRRTNFSGRGIAARDHGDVVRELLALRNAPELSSKLDAISANAWAPRLRSILGALKTPIADPLASRIAAAVPKGAADVFATAASELTHDELRTLYRVSAG